MKIRHYINKVITDAQTNWEKATHGNTVYYEFIDILQKWQENTKVAINLINFNYDTILDTDFSTILKIHLKELNSYVFNNACCRLFKPHGYTNWIHWAQTPLPVYGNVDHLAKQLSWTSYFDLASSTAIGQLGYYHKFPAIAVPTKTKYTFEFPKNNKEEMIKAINDTTFLLSIGWKAQ